ncbi:MAG: AEC family transporter, partial [Burkholderiaceae bacterium]
FVIGRIVGAWLFRLDGVGQSVFALGGIFSNNVLLGVPLAKVLLGDAAMPTISLIIVFNTLTLWMLVTVSVEWARNGDMSLRGFTKTIKGLLTNPVIASILAGAAFGLTGLTLPAMIDKPLSLMADSATPLALVVLGMGLAEYGVRSGWRAGTAIAFLKLIGQPLVIWVIAWLIGLPLLETQAAVLLASLSVGVNVYLMAREFDAMQSAVASSMVLSTVLAVVTTPLALALVSG